MNYQVTGRVLGGLLLFLAAMLLLPTTVAVISRDGAAWAFLISAGACLTVGLPTYVSTRAEGEISHREGFGIVTFGWLTFAVFGSLPYVLCDPSLSLIDAFFESMSGFTTTGATVISDLGSMPASVLLWRSMTQWIGGMGIVVLGLAILPFLGVGGMQLYQAEMPGPTADRLRPRIQDTAKILWGVYLGLTVAVFILLLLGGLSLHEATCHAFTTAATGGFSTRDGSVGAFDSSYVHVVITVFMLLGGINFTLHFAALSGRPRRYLKSQELLAYVAIFLGATLLVFACILPDSPDALTACRDAAFQVASIQTTSGFTTVDYELWAPVAKLALVVLMVIGGCAGSTTGGMKLVRVLLVLKHALHQVHRLLHPREVKVLKLDRSVVPQDILRNILGFVALYVGVFTVATLAMAWTGEDLVTAPVSVIACLSNIGPGLGEVGPTDNFAALTTPAKLVLTTCMLLGRLEIFTVLVIFFPSFWRR